METLKELLFVENQTVTVKSLSRALLLDVPSCKELIRQSSELPDVVPIYLVKKIQDGSIFVSLMDHQEYTAIKDKSNITSYVYAVSTGIVADLANLALVNQEAGKLDSIDSVRKLRSTINSSVVVAKKRAYSAPAPVQPSRIAAAKPVQKNQPAKERKSATKGSTFFGSKSKTSAAPATIITTTTPMEDSETTKSLKNKDVEKEEIITRKAKPAIKTTAKSKAQAKEIAGLFDDALTTKRTISVESDEETNNPISFPISSADPQQRVRKRRKVKKSKTVMDGKYMKTIDVTDWESYSEDEVVKKSTAKPAEPTAKASKPLAKNQKSIANFFNRS